MRKTLTMHIRNHPSFRLTWTWTSMDRRPRSTKRRKAQNPGSGARFEAGSFPRSRGTPGWRTPETHSSGTCILVSGFLKIIVNCTLPLSKIRVILYFARGGWRTNLFNALMREKSPQFVFLHTSSKILVSFLILLGVFFNCHTSQS